LGAWRALSPQLSPHMGRKRPTGKAMRLTDKTIRSAKPQDKPYKLADGYGLYLDISPSGGKVWRMKYRLGGKEKKLTIGAYPGVSLFDARETALRAKRAISEGSDPAREKQADIRAARLAEVNTLEAVAHEWHRIKAKTLTPKVAANQLALLEKDVFPVLGKLAVSTLSAPDILHAVRLVERRSPLLAAKTLRLIGRVLRYAVQVGLAANNPARDLSGVTVAHRSENLPALPRDDIRAFLEALGRDGGDANTKTALRLLLLVFVRPGELCGARWDEIDFDKREWRIPAERMKMRIAHTVPLSRQAAALLESIKPSHSAGRFVFPSSAKDGHLHTATLSSSMKRLGYAGKATPHGFRALASTVLNEEGFPPDAIERQLAHAERNKVRAAYHRAEYMAARRRMMQWWADFIDAQHAGNVVPVNFQRAAG